MKEFIIGDIDTVYASHCKISTNESCTTIHRYNDFSKATHSVIIKDDGNGESEIVVKVKGRKRKIRVPFYVLFDLEDMLRCWRSVDPNLGEKSRIMVGKEIE